MPDTDQPNPNDGKLIIVPAVIDETPVDNSDLFPDRATPADVEHVYTGAADADGRVHYKSPLRVGWEGIKQVYSAIRGRSEAIARVRKDKARGMDRIAAKTQNSIAGVAAPYKQSEHDYDLKIADAKAQLARLKAAKKIALSEKRQVRRLKKKAVAAALPSIQAAAQEAETEVLTAAGAERAKIAQTEGTQVIEAAKVVGADLVQVVVDDTVIIASTAADKTARGVAGTVVGTVYMIGGAIGGFFAAAALSAKKGFETGAEIAGKANLDPNSEDKVAARVVAASPEPSGGGE